jgi:integrase
MMGFAASLYMIAEAEWRIAFQCSCRNVCSSFRSAKCRLRVNNIALVKEETGSVADSAGDRRVPALDRCRQPGQFLFAGRGEPSRGLTTRQYARLVGEWIASIGLDPLKFGTHSLRRTKATLIYRRTGNLRAVQLLLGHTKIESTVRYLG